jgi:hypothetical protein
MLAYMVKDSVGVVNKKQIASKNGVLPKGQLNLVGMVVVVYIVV